MSIDTEAGVAVSRGTGSGLLPSSPRARRAPRPRGGAHGPSVLMAVPALAFLAAFAIIPLLGVIVLSLMAWDGLGTPTWAGLDNWVRTLTSPETHNAAWLSLVVMV